MSDDLDAAPAPGSDVPSDANEDFLFHLYRGSELLQDDRAHEAKEELERALHLQPHDTKGQDLLAVVYFRLGLYPRAIAILEQLRRKNPKDTAILLNLSLCFLKTGQPQLARRDLEQLLEVQPAHNRAWGYLGLACERLGDLEAAEQAFLRGGHQQMARRIADRRASQGSSVPPSTRQEPNDDSIVARAARHAVATAFEELDAGELSFELAAPADSGQEDEQAAQSWRPIELGRVARTDSGEPPKRPMTVAAPDLGGPHRKETPQEGTVAIPQLAAPPISLGRRQTLIAPAPPLASQEPNANAMRIPTARPPTFALDDAASPPTSLRHPVVAVPPVRREPKHSPPPVAREARVPTLPPPSLPAPPKSVAMHPSGLVLVRTTATHGFAARLEAIRASGAALAMKTLDRHVKGKTTGEPFGGAVSPIVSAVGEGQLVLGPRPGRKVTTFVLEDEMCFVREDALLGFDETVPYENGRLSLGEESLSIVQLRGRGVVLIETIGESLSLEVAQSRGVHVRRDAILGWFGRLVPRALLPNEAPAGQRGLVSFAGEGRVLVASA